MDRSMFFGGICVFLLAGLLAPSIGVSAGRSHKLGPYFLKANSNEKVEHSLIGSSQVISFVKGKRQLSFIHKSIPPQSIKTVREKILKMKGNPSKLKFQRFGRSALFYFHIKKSAYIMSTQGDMLIVTGAAKDISFKKIVGRRVRMK